MANASIYMLKFKTIDLVTNYLVGGHLLTWWLAIDLLSGQNVIANIRFWTNSFHKSCGHLPQISTKKGMSSFGLLEFMIWAEH